MRSKFLILVVAAISASAQTSTRKTVCASGCDYASTYAGLNSAVRDAAAYQNSSCVPYIIEIDPANPVDLNGNTLNLPAKTCAQYIRIRTRQAGSLPTDGTRVNPATQAPYMARIQSTMSAPNAFMVTVAARAKTRYWAFEGIDFYGNGQNAGRSSYNALLFFGDSGSTFPASPDRSTRPDHLEVKHCWFHGVPGARNVQNGIHVAGNSVRIVDSVIEDIAADGSEAHAVALTFTDGPVDIVNNLLDSATENSIVGGVLMPAGMLPSFLRFVGNQYSKKGYYKFTSGTTNPAWACRQGNVYRNTATNHDWICGSDGSWADQGGTTAFGPDNVKNLWEIKMGRGVRVFGNDMSGTWWPSAQNAEVFVMNLTTQDTTSNPAWVQPNFIKAQPWTTISDVQIDANRVHDAITFMTLAFPGNGGGPCAASFPQPWCYQNSHNDIRIHDNLIYNMADERDYNRGAPAGGWFGLLNKGDFDIDIRHNTFLLSTWSAASGAMNSIVNMAGAGTISGTINVRDNIIPKSAHSNTADGLGWGGTCSFVSGLGKNSVYSLRGNILTTDRQEWSYPLSFGPTPFPCAAYNLWPSGTVNGPSGKLITDANYRLTTYRNSAVDGRDAGADIDRVTWASAHAVDGSLNTALEYKLRSAVAFRSDAAKSANIYFTAPSGNACTWELSPDANGYSSPVPVTSQTRNGRDGVATWSGLAAGQVYFARATCDGLKLETGVEGRRFLFITAP